MVPGMDWLDAHKKEISVQVEDGMLSPLCNVDEY